ncbi:MAG TPA: VOC family protein [Gemmatimonadaceae bacterium]|nr:VOC family protein [Gemmatimonadaceae bacterium]
MRPERPEPILPARDLDETRAFYARLGFEPWFRGRGPWEYEIVSRGQLVVHFFAERGLVPGDNDSSCYWRVTDADRCYQEWSALGLPTEGIPRLTAPEDRPWGMREFTLVDPSGNLVRVGHELGPARVPASEA